MADIEGIPEVELMAVFPELFEPTPPSQRRAGRTLDFEAKLFMAKVRRLAPCPSGTQLNTTCLRLAKGTASAGR